MRAGLLVILLSVLGLVAWTAWHFWLIVPFSKPGKWLVSGLYVLSFFLTVPIMAYTFRQIKEEGR